MRTVGLVSWESGTGQNTVAVNLAMGLVRKGRRVILVNLNHNMRVFHWLKTAAAGEELSFDHIYSSSSGMDFVYPVAGMEHVKEKLSYDYAILNIGRDEAHYCRQGVSRSDLMVACTRLQSADECRQLLELQSRVKRYRQDDRGIDLLLPVQINSGEWKINSRRLFELVEAFGEEQIADFLPHCERIHDLFLQKQYVWNLSQPSIIDAFNRMLVRIEQLT
jgi:cellulose biosynthesis protein BcsQ